MQFVEPAVSMRNPGIAWAFGLVLAACGGSEPSLSGVFPAEGFAGRSLRVEISGDATEWTSGAVVNFGAGVTVADVTVASPTALFADISIDSAAATGLQDISVASEGTLTLKHAFEVRSPIALAFTGPVEQGGRPRFSIVNRDFAHPFDLTAESGELVDLAVQGPAGTHFVIESSTAFQLDGTAEIDGDATGGAVTVTSGEAPRKDVSVSDAIDVAPRAATPVISGGAVTGTIDGPGQTLWYALPAVAGLVHITGSVTGTGSPEVGILQDGTWSQIIGGLTTVLSTAKTVEIVVFDRTPAFGYSVTLTPVSEALATAAEPASDDTIATAATATSLPFELTDATLASATDVDYVKVVIDPAHAAKRLHVIAQAANHLTDTAIDITDGAGVSQITGPLDGGTSGGDGGFACGFLGNCGEDYVADPLPAGTYYVRVAKGSTPFDASFASYTLLLYFED